MEKLLNDQIASQIKDVLSGMVHPISIILFTKEGSCDTCLETKQLLSEVSALTDKIRFIEKDIEKDLSDVNAFDIKRVPSFVLLDDKGTYQGVKFNGIPAGHEINSFISALLEMSGTGIQFNEQIKEQIQKIDKPVDIKVFVTLSCPHCPGAVQNAHRLVMLNPLIKAEMVEAQTFQDMSMKYQVSGVPKIVINDTFELLGNQPIEAFLQQINKI